MSYKKHFTCLIQLTCLDFKKIQKNIIFLSDISVKDKVSSEDRKFKSVRYESFCSGINIKLKDKINAAKRNQEINVELHKTKFRCVYFCCSVAEILSVYPHTIFIPSSHKRGSPKKNALSLYAIISVLKIREDKHVPSVWSLNDLARVRSCKTSVVGDVNTSHFGAKGEYYSYGVRAAFHIENNSSLSLYKAKYTSSTKKQKIIKVEADNSEQKLAMECESFVSSFKNHLPRIHKHLSAIVDTAYKMQLEESVGSINLVNSPTSKNGLWQSQICVNASTASFHTENDCTYTLIGVPVQPKHNLYKFLFKINERITFSVVMNQNVSFIFSGSFLEHRQEFSSFTDDASGFFFNVASYGNGRLLSHIRQSILRVKN